MKNTVRDIDSACTKTKQLQTVYHMEHKELKNPIQGNYDDEIGPRGKKELLRIKYYILKLSKCEKEINSTKKKEKLETEIGIKEFIYCFIIRPQ